MISDAVLKEFSLEKVRCSLDDYEAIIVTNKSTWDYILQCHFTESSGWIYNHRWKQIRIPSTFGVIRFLDVDGLDLTSIQMFSCGSQNSTIIMDLENYKGEPDGILYLISRLRSVAECHTRMVIV